MDSTTTLLSHALLQAAFGAPTMSSGNDDLSAAAENDTLGDKLTQPHFDVVNYLNEALPALNLSAQSSSSKQNRNLLLQNASTETQSFLNSLSTHNIRASSNLSSLTDDILRSGNRLAYEVEVLRGDANNLYESLTEGLRDEISKFVVMQDLEHMENATDARDPITGEASETTQLEPDFIRQLRTLGQVKARLESVITVFGEAMKWPIPPSDVSVASSLISVSAPELGVVNSAEDDKAREEIRRYRAEIISLLDSDGGGYTGLEAATKRVNDFRNLALLWKGTSEEKARNRVVDGFAKILEDRQRALDARNPSQRALMTEPTRPSSVPARVGTPSLPTGGLFGGLRKLRDEIYLE